MPTEGSVTVVIAAYTLRRADVLRRSAFAAVQQLRADDEVAIVVDHNDELLAWAKRELDGVRIVPNESSSGLSGARNTGISHARGDIVAFLDDDAVPRSDWLATLRARFTDQSVVGVGGGIEPVWLSGRPTWFPDEFGWVVGCDYRGLPPAGARLRNPIGANMALRRDAFEAVGGFAAGLGRVGTLPAGCEETELGIRIGQHLRGQVIVREPRAVVDHEVPTDRGTVRYFLTRCWHEGKSKAALTRIAGATDGLSAERGYVARILPSGVARSVLAAARGDGSGFGRAGAIGLGFASVGAGYLAGLTRRARKADDEVGTDADKQQTRPAADPPAVRPHAELSAYRQPTSTPAVIREATPSPDARVTVVVCTLGRDERLIGTIEAIRQQDHRNLEILIVDNEPETGEVDRLVASASVDDRVRVVRQPRRGLSHARNAGLAAAGGEIVAFTDDDALPESDWISSLLRVFTADVGGEVWCVTGLVVPAELTTHAQELFEAGGGFGKGHATCWWKRHHPSVRLRSFGVPGREGPAFPYSAAEFGSGNNMSFRTDELRAIGGFDVTLGAGSLTRGGEDLDAFREIYFAGGAVVYTPDAVVGHFHRSDLGALRTQMFGYGTGMAASLTKLVLSRPGEVATFARTLPRSLRELLHPKSAKNATRGPSYPPQIARAELAGYGAGPFLYLRARLRERRAR
ncbi:glycosyltransferase [Cumulibacter soli]|uniref:glycosyltransferase n=1 Tax=Cumulibacter soli TaxID=2546344 RepID=UPI001068C543|nr:glycosyltransferase [Cumulibacter soli]